MTQACKLKWICALKWPTCNRAMINLQAIPISPFLALPLSFHCTWYASIIIIRALLNPPNPTSPFTITRAKRERERGGKSWWHYCHQRNSINIRISPGGGQRRRRKRRPRNLFPHTISLPPDAAAELLIQTINAKLRYGGVVGHEWAVVDEEVGQKCMLNSATSEEYMH